MYNKIIWNVILIVLLLVVIIGIAARILFDKTASNKPSIFRSKDVVATVGDESIYRKDINYVYESFPDGNRSARDNLIVNKLINESIIIQAAAKEKKVALASDIYNNPDKDRKKRDSAIDAIIASFSSEYAYTIWLNSKISDYKINIFL